MLYYDVILQSGGQTDTFTYHAQTDIPRRSLVQVPFRSNMTTGIVTENVSAPHFKTRPIEQILELPSMPEYTLDTIRWMAEYYGSSKGDALGLFLPQRPDLANYQDVEQLPPLPSRSSRPKLTDAQAQALDSIKTAPDAHWLLHGVTGSGKTEVYIELVRHMLQAGKSSIVLVPEISLALQTIKTFQEALGDRVLITHSHLTAAQRRKVWSRALLTPEPVVIIGPRSALFMPRYDLGAIVIDECHEQSYKQMQSPHYHARETAQFIASQTNSSLVLGSATPSAHDIYQQQNSKLSLLNLSQPIHANQRPVDIVDLRRQKSIISPQLHRELKTTLEQGRQALLFINRRGSASQVVCSGCGWVATCQECDIPQTWHGDSGRLRCHWCGYSRPLPSTCPECDHMQWRFIGLGTKRIENEINRILPQARIRRIDKDSFTPTVMSDTLKQLQDQEIDILIGTQMIAKGLDLPQVSLVGVILADTMLYIPDVSANERTYQLLHQVIGRAGRSHDNPSRVIIQTYTPEHHVIKAAAEHDYHNFMQTELEDRKALNYPPHTSLLKLTAKRKTQSGAKQAATKLKTKIQDQHSPKVSIRGPAPAWRERVGPHYYWHIVITSQDRANLLNIMQDLPANWRADIDPIDLL